jgi:hypothetical protein
LKGSACDALAAGSEERGKEDDETDWVGSLDMTGALEKRRENSFWESEVVTCALLARMSKDTSLVAAKPPQVARVVGLHGSLVGTVQWRRKDASLSADRQA